MNLEYLPDLQNLSWFLSVGLSLGYLFFRLAVVYGLFFILVKVFRKSHSVVKDKLPPGQIRFETFANIKAYFFDAMVFVVLLKFGAFQSKALVPMNILYTFAFCYVFFEIWFYATHRLMHMKSVWFTHKLHHKSVQTTLMTAQSTGLYEKTINDIGILLIPALLTQITPMNIEGIIGYHFVNFYINVLGHSNLELAPKFLRKYRWGRIFTTPTYHSLHHLKGNCNFGLFTTVLDRLFGTFDPKNLIYYDEVKKHSGLFKREFLKYSKAAI